MKNPFKLLDKKDWVVYIISLVVVIASNVVTLQFDALNFFSTVIGVTALIFIAKGNVWGQILSVVFCALYGIISLRFRYYGEMITYLGMSMPIAVFSIITWLKNPYKKGEGVVKIRKFTFFECVIMLLIAIGVAVGFYFVLRVFDTPNLIISTISVTTSFCAAYLMLRRISYYAIAYALNDIILIILWVLATIENIIYLPVVACFLIFLLNDLYAFISWKAREKYQLKENKKKAG